jgi:hypothetical protein
MTWEIELKVVVAYLMFCSGIRPVGMRTISTTGTAAVFQLYISQRNSDALPLMKSA